MLNKQPIHIFRLNTIFNHAVECINMFLCSKPKTKMLILLLSSNSPNTLYNFFLSKVLHIFTQVTMTKLVIGAIYVITICNNQVESLRVSKSFIFRV